VSVEFDDGLTGPLLPPRFEAVRLLGRGGMGDVYLAWDRLLSRQVAIKVLAPELADDAVARERFAREAALAGRLGSHPHIVTTHDAGEWEGRPYVVFEYLPNGSLADRQHENAPPPATVLRWLGQAAAALDYAHAAAVVHRDVKPANLLLDADDNVAVADFGVSRRDGETTLTAQGDVVGTAGYLAPEQLDGRGATAASDRFALAVVARQLLGDQAGPLQAVFGHALADEPDRRYPTATAFVDALRAAMPVPTRRRLLPPRTTPGARGVPPPARHTQRTKLWRVGVALVAAVAIAAPATAGGVVLGRRLAHAQPSRPQSRVVATRCAVSPFAADANLVVSGVGATAFCRSQAETLSAQGSSWAFRPGTKLLAPDSGNPSELSRICALARGHLTAAVYDDLGRRIGTDLCHAYAASGWELRS
jgi:protein kinase-like protein